MRNFFKQESFRPNHTWTIEEYNQLSSEVLHMLLRLCAPLEKIKLLNQDSRIQVNLGKEDTRTSTIYIVVLRMEKEKEIKNG